MLDKYFSGLATVQRTILRQRMFGESIPRLHSCGSDSNEQRVLRKIIQSSSGH